MAKNCHNDYKMKFSVDEEFPDLSLHNNHMAKVQILETQIFSLVAFEWSNRFYNRVLRYFTVTQHN